MVKVIVVIEVTVIVDGFEDVNAAAGEVWMQASKPMGDDWTISRPARILEVKAGKVVE